MASFYDWLIYQKKFASNQDINQSVAEGLPPDFVSHYKKHIEPLVKLFENKRLKALKDARAQTKRMCFWLALFAVIASFFIFYIDLKEIDGLICIFTIWFLYIAVCAFTYAIPIWTYQDNVKSTIYPKIFKFFGDDFIFKQTSGGTASTLKKSHIIPRNSEINTGDYVKGSYKDVAIELTDTQINTIKEHKLPKILSVLSNDDMKKFFGGLTILLTMNKKFQGQTILKRDRGIMHNLLNRSLFGSKYSKVNLEDPLFEKKFEVFSTDQIEARYLLTTSFMDRLLNLERICHSGVMASFFDDKLLLMIPYKGAWLQQPSLHTEVTFIYESKTIIKQIHEIYKIIDLLKLAERTGL